MIIISMVICFNALHISQQFLNSCQDDFLSSSVEPVLSSGESILLKDTTQ